MATILIVDDDPQSRVLLSALLSEKAGHDLVFAPDGKTALERYERLNPQLVITDLVMPELNGHRLIEELISLDEDARIIAISGKAPEQLERAEDAGALASFPKPLDGEALIAAVEEALAAPRRDMWRWG